MSQLFVRRREVVEAVQFAGQRLPGIEYHKSGRTSPHHKCGIPAIWTRQGLTALFLGDIILKHADGTRTVILPEQFDLDWEPV